MPYVSPEEVRAAKQMDLLTYLQSYEPNELVKLSGGTYCTRQHDSLKISNGKWHWFSRGIGGSTALDYLIKVQDYGFPEAVETILGRVAVRPPIFHAPRAEQSKRLLLPEANNNCDAVIHYLRGRGIDREIIDYCLGHKLLFETKKYHNAVFVGYDPAGRARYAALRGTYGDFKGEVTGSDKHYSFALTASGHGETVHLFEAAIDALSYATLLKMTGRDWRKDTLLSLAGVYKAKTEYTVPMALDQYLHDHSTVETLLLHLDNDEVGRGATQGIIKNLGGKYRVIDSPSPTGKDVNDYLMERIERHRRKEEQTR